MADVEFAFTADTKALRAELDKLPKAAGKAGDKMRKALQSDLKKIEEAAKATADGSEKAFKGLAEGAGDSESALKGLADVVEGISPRAADALRGLGDLGGGVEALTNGVGGLDAELAASAVAMSGPVAAAAATLGAAYLVLAANLDEALMRQEQANALSAEVTTAYTEQTRVTLALGVANGTLNAEVLEGFEAQEKAKGAYKGAREEIDKQKEAVKLAIDEQESWNTKIKDAAKDAARLVSPLGFLVTIYDELGLGGKSAEELAIQLENLDNVSRNLAEGQKKMAEEIEETAEEKRKSAAATAWLAEQERAAAAEAQENAEVVQAFWEMARERFEERQAEMQAEIELQDEINAAINDMAALQAKAHKANAKAEDDAAKQRAAALKDQKRIQEALVSSSFDTMTSLATAAADVLEATGRKSAGIAKKLFRFQQALAIAETIIGTAKAITSALDDLPFPANIAAAAVAGGIGTAQTAIIAAQSPPEFPTGGIVRPSQDHQMIAAQAGEGVLTRDAVDRIGEDGVNALNAGGTTAGGNPPVVLVYKHRQLNAVLEDNVRIPGSPLNRELNRDRRAGRRRRLV